MEKDHDDLSPSTRDNMSLDDWQRSWMAQNNTPSLFISARYKTHAEEFKALLYQEVKKIHVQRFPYNDFLFDLPEEEPSSSPTL